MKYSSRMICGFCAKEQVYCFSSFIYVLFNFVNLCFIGPQKNFFFQFITRVIVIAYLSLQWHNSGFGHIGPRKSLPHPLLKKKEKKKRIYGFLSMEIKNHIHYLIFTCKEYDLSTIY